MNVTHNTYEPTNLVPKDWGRTKLFIYIYEISINTSVCCR